MNENLGIKQRLQNGNAVFTIWSHVMRKQQWHIPENQADIRSEWKCQAFAYDPCNFRRGSLQTFAFHFKTTLLQECSRSEFNWKMTSFLKSVFQLLRLWCDLLHPNIIFQEVWLVKKMCSGTGNRTRACWVRASYPNHQTMPELLRVSVKTENKNM